MEHVIVERDFDEPMDAAQIAAMKMDSMSCLDAHRVRHLESFLSADGRRMICHFHAPDAESVRLVFRQLNSPAARIWTATVLAETEGSATDSGQTCGA